ncbi:MAG: cell division protein ZapE [Micrococcaceae bacterium]
MPTFQHLSKRNPTVSATELLETFVPAQRFTQVSFENFIPDSNYPSQSQAVVELEKFAQGIVPAKKSLFSRFSKQKSNVAGIYLDGGFGVGKTHLLTSLWKVAPQEKAIGTFVEYTNFVGALGFHKAVELLKNYKLICIDEFELDDPGDTVLMSRLMRELADHGVKLAATSNTLPGALGEGRFAAEDFQREIQVLSKQFEVLRIDGEDYRQQENTSISAPSTPEQLQEYLEHCNPETTSVDEFSQLVKHLSVVHPSRYKKMVAGLKHVVFENVIPLEHIDKALRFVVLIDRLYDSEVSLKYSGTSLEQIFPAEMLSSGYQKKFYRCLSRLSTMTS